MLVGACRAVYVGGQVTPPPLEFGGDWRKMSLPGTAVRRIALRMAGLLIPPPPPPPDADGKGVAAALAAVNEARALAIIAASALALCVAFAAEALPVPTASGAVELDWQEATPPSAKFGCVTAPAHRHFKELFCFDFGGFGDFWKRVTRNMKREKNKIRNSVGKLPDREQRTHSLTYNLSTHTELSTCADVFLLKGGK